MGCATISLLVDGVGFGIELGLGIRGADCCDILLTSAGTRVHQKRSVEAARPQGFSTESIRSARAEAIRASDTWVGTEATRLLEQEGTMRRLLGAVNSL